MEVYIILGIIIFLLLVSLFTSRTRVVKLYNKYSKVYNSKNITGEQFAFFARQKLGYDKLNFSLIKGKMTDCYVPKTKTLCLSEEVAHTPSIASIAIVAHELGHAEQHFSGSLLFKLNHFFACLTRLTSKLILPCLVFGLIAHIFKWPTENLGMILMITSGVLFGIAVLVKLLVIPVEINASNRALKFLTKNGIITNKELPKVKKLLRTAGRTYVVALFDGIIIPIKKFDRKIRG